MYEKAGSTERMLSILIDNARKSPNSAYFYELKQYYLALPEESVKKKSGAYVWHEYAAIAIAESGRK